MLFIAVFILADLLHCACSSYTATNCVGTDTAHRSCLVTEDNTCSEKCINADLYEATGDNKKCIVKACTSYDEKTCYLNDACVLTEQTPTKCASACLDFKVFLPVDGKCVKSGCRERKPKSMTVFVKINRVIFNYGYKTNNNVGVTVMGIQKNTSFHNGTGTQSDFNYTNEVGFEWENVREENLENVRIQVYTDKQYFIGQAYLNISEYKTPDGLRKNITVESGDVTIPIQNQTLTVEVGVCTSCASSGWPCGNADEAEECYQDMDNCSPTCTNTDTAHYEADTLTGVCERVCEERNKSAEETWSCGKDYEKTLCYVNTGAGVGEPECARECSQEGWYTMEQGSGKCELKDCTARLANLTAAHPCGSAVDCVFDPEAPIGGPPCVESCVKNERHTGEIENGRCVVVCALREANLTAAHPCGGDCLFDPVAPVDDPRCVESCPDDDAHTGKTDGGRCVVGLNCDARNPDVAAALPCGEAQDCLYDPVASACVASCPKDADHTGEIEDGWCELACALQKADISATFPCGDALDCLFDPTAPAEGPQCVDACPKDDTHTGKSVDGWCVLVCDARDADVAATWPCGTDCYFDPEALIGGPVCVESCEKDERHTGGTEEGRCSLSCALRKANVDATIPCGRDCLYDPAVPADGSDGPQCVEKCPVDENHSGEVFSGRCVEGLNCAARKANITAELPCARDCQFDTTAPSGGPQCVAECPVDTTHTGQAEDGKCLVACAIRKADTAAADFPCKRDGCLFDSAAPADGQQCVEECPVDDMHSGESTDGVCATGAVANGGTDTEKGWWEGGKIIGLPRMWFVIIVAIVAFFLLLLVVIIIIVIIRRSQKKKAADGYVSINNEEEEEEGGGVRR